MDFKLTEEQQMLQETAARLVRDAYTFDKREKFSASETGFRWSDHPAGFGRAERRTAGRDRQR